MSTIDTSAAALEFESSLQFPAGVIAQTQADIAAYVANIFADPKTYRTALQSVEQHMTKRFTVPFVLRGTVQLADVQRWIAANRRTVFTLSTMLRMGAELDIVEDTPQSIVIADVAKNTNTSAQMDVYNSMINTMCCDQVFRAHPTFLQHLREADQRYRGKPGFSYYHAHTLFTSIGAELLLPSHYAVLRSRVNNFGRQSSDWLRSYGNELEVGAANSGDSRKGVMPAMAHAHHPSYAGRGQVEIAKQTV